jgi:hypothetical protein
MRGLRGLLGLLGLRGLQSQLKGLGRPVDELHLKVLRGFGSGLLVGDLRGLRGPHLKGHIYKHFDPKNSYAFYYFYDYYYIKCKCICICTSRTKHEQTFRFVHLSMHNNSLNKKKFSIFICDIFIESTINSEIDLRCLLNPSIRPETSGL